MSGLRGEVTEADELLSAMRETREEICMQKAEDRFVVQEREERKLEGGSRVVAKARNSGAIVSDEQDENSERNSGDGDGAERGGDSRRKKRRTVNH